MTSLPVIVTIDNETGMLEPLARVPRPDYVVHTASYGADGLPRAGTVHPDLVRNCPTQIQIRPGTILRNN